VLRLLSERRDDLAGERTRTANRLHALLRDLIPGGAKRNLSAEQAAGLLRGVHPLTAVDVQRKALSRELVADLRQLDAALTRNSEDIAAAVNAAGTSMTQIHGVGPVLAAKIIDTPARLSASRAATTTPATAAAPIEASSGEQRRHRLSRAGNRQLNRAVHLVAVCQIRTDGPGREFYQRKLGEAKTPAEARRALKRRLCDTIYRHLVQDHQLTT
jgi:transposase